MGVLEMGGFVISWGLWRQFWAVVAPIGSITTIGVVYFAELVEYVIIY